MTSRYEHVPEQRTFCYQDEGILTAATIMSDFHIDQVLVLNNDQAVVGAYILRPEGIIFRRLGSFEHSKSSPARSGIWH